MNRGINIMDWNECLKKFIRETEIDEERIDSIVRKAKDRLKRARKTEVTKDNIFFIVEDYYEVIKELLVAYLLKNGLRSKNHQCLISYFYKQNLDYEKEAFLISQMSFFRNRLNYYGEDVPEEFYNVNKEEFEKMVKIILRLIEIEIKLVVFDFGGVFFTYDVDKLLSEFSIKLKITKELAEKAWRTKLDSFVKGECSEDEFWEAFLKITDKKHDKKELHDVVINQFKPIPEIKELIDKLKQNYQVGMLTNQTTWLDELDKIYNFYPQFNPLIVSKNVKTQKPEEKIFRLLIEESRLNPDKIVFIDDNDYKKVTERLGIKFIQFKDIEQLKKELRELDIKF